MDTGNSVVMGKRRGSGAGWRWVKEGMETSVIMSTRKYFKIFICLSFPVPLPAKNAYVLISALHLFKSYPTFKSQIKL